MVALGPEYYILSGLAYDGGPEAQPDRNASDIYDALRYQTKPPRDWGLVGMHDTLGKKPYQKGRIHSCGVALWWPCEGLTRKTCSDLRDRRDEAAMRITGRSVPRIISFHGANILRCCWNAAIDAARFFRRDNGETSPSRSYDINETGHDWGSRMREGTPISHFGQGWLCLGSNKLKQSCQIQSAGFLWPAKRLEHNQWPTRWIPRNTPS